MQLVDQFVCNYGKTYNEFLTTNEDREHDWLGLEEVVDEGDPSVGEDSSTLSDTPDPLAMKLPNQPLLTRKMRRTLVNWLSEVAQEFKVSDSGYHLAVSILDAILAKGPTVQEYVKYYCDDFTTVSDDAYGDKFLIHRKYFQAVGWYVLFFSSCFSCLYRFVSNNVSITIILFSACVLIASKIEDKTPPRVENLVYISDYSFSTAKLIDLESTICEQLEFRLFLKTPVMFMDLNLRASQASEHHSCRHYRNPMLESTLKYLLELSRSSYELSQRKPSLICAACTYLARATLGIGEYWTSTLEYYTGYNKNDLTDTIVKVHLLHMAAEKSDRFGTTPAYTKYATDKLHRVSLKTVRRLEDLGLDVFETHDESFSADSDYAIVI